MSVVGTSDKSCRFQSEASGGGGGCMRGCMYIYFRIGPSDLFAPVFCGDFAIVLADITESKKQGVRIKSKACRVILYFFLYPHHRISRSHPIFQDIKYWKNV
jgi:hypothetical protein